MNCIEGSPTKGHPHHGSMVPRCPNALHDPGASRHRCGLMQYVTGTPGDLFQRAAGRRPDSVMNRLAGYSELPGVSVSCE
jgi:hypothetical protein